MNGRERFRACMNFEKGAKSVKGEMCFWYETVVRWRSEGLPVEGNMVGAIGHNIRSNIMPVFLDTDIVDRDIYRYFSFDVKSMAVPSTFSPFFEKIIIEETENHIIFRDDYGITQKKIKDENGGIKSGMPMFIDRPVKDRADFHAYRERYDNDFDKRLKGDWVE
jgi:hypothetical protein